MPDTKIEVELSQLKPGDNVAGFSVGHADYTVLKTFFQKHAKTYEERSLARTYVLREKPSKKLVGYVTLVCGEVLTKDDPNALDGEKYPYPTSPAIKVARLLVDSTYRNTGVGRQLVEFAIGRAKQVVCPTVGCRFIVVDAKKASVDFYKKCGFSLLKTEDNENSNQPLMFLDLHKATS